MPNYAYYFGVDTINPKHNLIAQIDYTRETVSLAEDFGSSQYMSTEHEPIAQEFLKLRLNIDSIEFLLHF